jgi:prepilin-type N-terminal cleavage/methylation domain-containing protein
MIEKQRRKGAGLTMIEVLVSISIVAVLAGILVPILLGAKTRAAASNCAIALGSSNRAINLYSADHDDVAPPSEAGVITREEGITSGTMTYKHLIKAYGGSESCESVPSVASSAQPWLVPQCLNGSLNYSRSIDSTTDDVFGKGIFMIGKNLGIIADPSSTILSHECRPGLTALGIPDAKQVPLRPGATDLRAWYGLHPRAFHFFGGSTYAYVDLHIKWKRPSQLSEELNSDHTFKP